MKHSGLCVFIGRKGLNAGSDENLVRKRQYWYTSQGLEAL